MAGMSFDDIIVSPKDGALFNKFHRNSIKQARKVFASINPHMWGEFVAQGSGKPVDQGSVPKMILTFPVMTVGFKRVAPIRTKKDDASARFEHAHYFTDGFMIILNMFEHFVA